MPTPSRLRRLGRPALTLLLLLAACRPAADPGPSPAPTQAPVEAAATSAAPTEGLSASAVPPTPTGEPAAVVDPLTVSPTLDESGAAGAVIGPEGGTLLATGADGSAFSLTIPEDSLLAPVMITLTPVSALANLPLSGGLAAGAQLEPEGLWLSVPATLVITPAQTLAPEQQDFFAYNGAGEDWHAYPPLTTTDTLALSVGHFSGYGVGSGTPADRAALEEHLPSDRMAQIEATVAELFRAESEYQKTNGHPSPDFFDRLYAQVRLAFNTVVQPAVEAALASDEYDAIAAAIKTMLAWQRFAALVDPAEFATEMQYTAEKMDALVARGVPVAGRECREQHIYSRIFTLFQLARTMALLGMPTANSSFDEIRACLRFELTFVSVITEGGFGDPYGYRYEVKATVPLAVGESNDQLVTGRLEGTGTLTYVSVGWIGSPQCTFAAAGTGAVFTVQGGVNGVPFPFAPGATTVEITYDPGVPTEAVTMSCPSADPLSWETTAWKTYFDQMHAAEKIENSYRLVTPLLDYDIIARSQQHLTTLGPSGQEVIEDTFIQIVHKPVN